MELNDFIKNFSDQFDDLDSVDLTANTKFKELDDWSSLVALSLIAMVDEVYNITITGEDIRESSTVGDLFERIKNK